MELIIYTIFLSLMYSIYNTLTTRAYRVHVYIQSELIGISIRNKTKIDQVFLYFFVMMIFHLTNNLSYIVLVFYYIWCMIKGYDKSFKTFIIEIYLKNFERTKSKYNNKELLDQI